MLHDVLMRFDACLQDDPTRTDSPLARAFLGTFQAAHPHDQPTIAAYVDHCLEQLGHPEPSIWLLCAALHKLGRALSQNPIDRANTVRGLSILACLVSLNDPLDHAWKLTRAGKHGAMLQAQSHLGQGTYRLSVLTSNAEAQRLRYHAPSLELWWRSGGATWVCDGLASTPRGGMFVPDAHGTFDPIPLASALLGKSHHASLGRPALAASMRAWDRAHARGRRAPKTPQPQRADLAKNGSLMLLHAL